MKPEKIEYRGYLIILYAPDASPGSIWHAVIRQLGGFRALPDLPTDHSRDGALEKARIIIIDHLMGELRSASTPRKRVKHAVTAETLAHDS